MGSLPSALAYTPGGKRAARRDPGRRHAAARSTRPPTTSCTRSAVGVEPDAVAVAPGGTGGKGVALVANLDSNNVTPVDLGHLAGRHGRSRWATEPVAIAVSVGTRRGPPPRSSPTSASNTVTPIDVATLRPGPAIAVGPGPRRWPSRRGEVLVGNFGNRTLTADQRRRRCRRAAPLRSRSTRPASRSSPSGATAYVCGGAAVVP